MHNDMVRVTRKDEKEANENVLRRFNRRLLQSGVMQKARASMRFEKPISKTVRRSRAIVRRMRKAEKTQKLHGSGAPLRCVRGALCGAFLLGACDKGGLCRASA